MDCGREEGKNLRLKLAAVLVIAGCLGGSLTGCVESLPFSELPSLVKDPRKYLTKEEQAQAISDLTQKKDVLTTQALKETQKDQKDQKDK